MGVRGDGVRPSAGPLGEFRACAEDWRGGGGSMGPGREGVCCYGSCPARRGWLRFAPRRHVSCLGFAVVWVGRARAYSRSSGLPTCRCTSLGGVFICDRAAS